MPIYFTHLTRLSQARCVSSSVTQTSPVREKRGLPALHIPYPPLLEVDAVGLLWGYNAFCGTAYGDLVVLCPVVVWGVPE